MSVVCVLARFVFGIEVAMMEEGLVCRFVPEYHSASTLMVVILGFIFPACIIFICAVILFQIVRKQIIEIGALADPAATTQAQCFLTHKEL